MSHVQPITPTTCKCETCGEHSGPLVLHSKCHPDAPTWNVLRDNDLTVACSVCNKPITTLRVEGFVKPTQEGVPSV